MWLLMVCIPLVPVIGMTLSRYHVKVTALCRRTLSWVLKLVQGRVCVRSTHAFVFSKCTHGKVHSVLETFDLHAETHPSLSIGPHTGHVLDEVVRRVHPQRVLELGMHCGYSSIRMLRLLPPSGKLVTVEQDPYTADLGEELILVAGFKYSQFQVVTCTSAEAISALSPCFGQEQGIGVGLDLVLMDHSPELYLPDLLALEREGLLNASGCSILLIHRSSGFTAPRDLLEYFRDRPECYSVKGGLHHGMMEVFYQKDGCCIRVD